MHTHHTMLALTTQPSWHDWPKMGWEGVKRKLELEGWSYIL